MAQLLEDGEIADRLAQLHDWERRGTAIVKTFTCRDFAEAMSFTNRVADAAEAANHHPDIDIRYNKVTLGLTTHSEGGLTSKDFELANGIESLAPS